MTKKSTVVERVATPFQSGKLKLSLEGVIKIATEERGNHIRENFIQDANTLL